MAIQKQENYKTDAFMTRSPFHFQEGYQIQIENRNKNCSHTEIDTLALKGLLNPVDFEILKLLGTYCYVNTHNLNYALNHTLPENYRKQDYKRNLKKLSDAGILLKHSICIQTDGECSARQIVSPLRFYSLSPGARSYISSLMEAPYISGQTLPAYRIIELMAAAQLLIHFQASYRDSVKKLLFNLHKQIGSHLLLLDAYIRYSVSQGNSPSPAVHLFLLCGRNNGDNYADIVLRSHLLFCWLDRHKEEYPCHMILLLLESISDIPPVYLQIRKLYMSGKTGITDSLYPLYFTLDTNVLVQPLFDALYQCEIEEDSGRCKISKISLGMAASLCHG